LLNKKEMEMKKIISTGGVHREVLTKRGYRWSDRIHSGVFGNIFPKRREK
jgi:hypothetical protein